MKRQIIISSIIIFAVVLISSLFCFNYVFKSDKSKYKNLMYSSETIKLIKAKNIEKEVLNNKYSKTLEVALTNNEYIGSNLDIYLKLDYIEKDDYIEKINTLSKLGYDLSEIEYIFKNVDYDELNYIVDTEYISNLKDYMVYKNFRISNLNRYINYRNNNDIDIKNIILNVNMNLDKKTYEEFNIISNTDDILILVNKYNRLPDNYEPSNLSKISSNCAIKELYLKDEATNQFNKMCSDASSLGLNIKAISSYRTKEYQEQLYNDYVNKSGMEEADTYSARPRFSEHETGLALDIMGSNKDYTRFAYTNEFNWVKENMHNYGFIIRYPENKEDITKYIYESWHLRYVGVEIAKYIYENNLTLEEYLALK